MVDWLIIRNLLMKKILSVLIIYIVAFSAFSLVGCEDLTNSKGKYFVDSDYIIATASLTSTTKNANGEIEYYGIDISHDSDIKLNYIK